ncbi:MAG TPA: glycosyltransferase family 39 protein [Chitinophagaceae bacterium]
MRIRTISPFLLFLPFLIFYVVIILVFHNNQLADDEIRYLGFAGKLTHGFYSAPPPNVFIPNGPGYPIILMPLVALHAPVILIVLTNALFYYLSVVFLFKALLRISSFKVALISGFFWACYYNSYQDMLFAFTETFTCLNVSLIIYFLVNAFDNSNGEKKGKYTVLSGISIGYLVLTKIVFGYVLLCMLIVGGILWMLKRTSPNYKKNLVVLAISFATILPYLVYTYYLTGRLFYLGNPGADSLYWMSTPYAEEYGDWQSFPRVPGPDIYRVHDSEDSLAANHKKDFENVYRFQGTKQDDAFRKIALENIKSHPLKFIENCVSNLGRMLFSFPNSYTKQNNKTLFRLPLNGIIAVLSIYCFIPTLLNWRNIKFPIRFLLFFALIYLGGSTLVSGLTRMFTIIAPVFIVWIAFIFQKTVAINLKFSKD